MYAIVDLILKFDSSKSRKCRCNSLNFEHWSNQNWVPTLSTSEESCWRNTQTSSIYMFAWSSSLRLKVQHKNLYLVEVIDLFQIISNYWTMSRSNYEKTKRRGCMCNLARAQSAGGFTSATCINLIQLAYFLPPGQFSKSAELCPGCLHRTNRPSSTIIFVCFSTQTVDPKTNHVLR